MIWIAYALIFLVVMQRLGELVLANRNTQKLKAKGAIEIGAGHYPLIVFLHGAWLLATLWLLPAHPVISWPWLAIFVLLEIARVWVIASLGPYWTTRIISLPGAPLVKKGPYRFVRHPNYMVVAGEIVVLPLHPGMELDVREHAFLLASHTIQYSFIRIKGLVNLLHGGNGMYIDRFVTAGYPGMLILHGNGDVLERMLRPGEKILVEPGGFLYKDSTVQMQAMQMPLKTGLLRHGMYLAEMTGPGRVGIQSMYVHHHAD